MSLEWQYDLKSEQWCFFLPGGVCAFRAYEYKGEIIADSDRRVRHVSPELIERIVQTLLDWLKDRESFASSDCLAVSLSVDEKTLLSERVDETFLDFLWWNLGIEKA